MLEPRLLHVLSAAALGLAAGLLVACTDDDSLGVKPGVDALERPSEEGCRPTAANRPVCSSGGALTTFIDPTAEITGSEHVVLAEHVYVGPFARLLAGGDEEDEDDGRDDGGDDDGDGGDDADAQARISIGEESNVQDNVTIVARVDRDDDAEDRVEAIGLDDDDGVEIAERVILAHGATVKGPARIGIGGGDIPPDPDDDQEVFLSFATEVDGAVLERNTGISALGRVGPGVRLKSGFIVLPGKNVTTQAEADDPGLGKVRLITEADVAFNEAVIEVNTAFAREYPRLYADNPSFVRGINFDPGNTEFNPTRDLPVLAGEATQAPGFRNRIIGEITLANSLAELQRVMGSRVSLRADEGEPFEVGRIERMGDGVIFHALEETPITVGEGVTYGKGAIVHGGGRRPLLGGGDDEPTIIGDGVTLKDQAVVFRALIGKGATIGVKSAIVNTDIAPGTVIPDRTIYVNNARFGTVEW
jgi:carbonic anhydrase/acetyltransferase-like protein (isoleucine patch superfamily)